MSDVNTDKIVADKDDAHLMRKTLRWEVPRDASKLFDVSTLNKNVKNVLFTEVLVADSRVARVMFGALIVLTDACYFTFTAGLSNEEAKLTIGGHVKPDQMRASVMMMAQRCVFQGTYAGIGMFEGDPKPTWRDTTPFPRSCDCRTSPRTELLCVGGDVVAAVDHHDELYIVSAVSAETLDEIQIQIPASMGVDKVREAIVAETAAGALGSASEYVARLSRV